MQLVPPVLRSVERQSDGRVLFTFDPYTFPPDAYGVSGSCQGFDENGNLIHEPTKQLIQELLKNLVDWTRRISPALAREASP